MSSNIVGLVLDTERRLTSEEIKQRKPPWLENVVHVTQIDWENDFSAARNTALDIANMTKADWALWLDTDMHYTEKSGDLLSVLEETDAVAVQLPERGGRYVKDCLIRLPPRGRYVGLTHEYFDTPGNRITLPWPQFWEDDKSQNRLMGKLMRDKALLEKMLCSDPDNARAHYYLGDTYANLGKNGRAEEEFDLCEGLSNWDEERAWCCYRVASLMFEEKDYGNTLYWCLSGMKHHAGVSELYWLAGVACYWLGQHVNASCWARMALEIEEMEGTVFKRGGWRYTPVRYEGPHDVLRGSYKTLGLNWLADIEEDRYRSQLEHRLRGGD